ncbi:hypothetical protein COOONC_13703 [Cooperia oncophora]
MNAEAQFRCLSYHKLSQTFMNFHRINPNLRWNNGLAIDACNELKEEEEDHEVKHRLVVKKSVSALTC